MGDAKITRATRVRVDDKRTSIQVASWTDGGVSLFYVHGRATFAPGNMTGAEALALADALIEAARVAGPASAQDDDAAETQAVAP